MDKIHVLLTNGYYPDLYAIKSFLQQSRDPEYATHYFSDPKDAIAFLQTGSVDVILTSAGKHTAFKEMIEFVMTTRISAPKIPVIVFCSEVQRKSIDQIISAGAEDIVSREHFLTNCESLHNAIGLALARHQKTSSHIDTAIQTAKLLDSSILEDQQFKAAADLKQSQEDHARALLDVQLKASAQLAEQQEKAATTLKTSQAKSADDLERSQSEHARDSVALKTEMADEARAYGEVYFWMHGGYSMQEYLKDSQSSTPTQLDSQLESADALKADRINAANNLREEQRNAADSLLDSNQAAASELKKVQEQAAADLKSHQEEAALCQRWLDIKN